MNLFEDMTFEQRLKFFNRVSEVRINFIAWSDRFDKFRLPKLGLFKQQRYIRALLRVMESISRDQDEEIKWLDHVRR